MRGQELHSSPWPLVRRQHGVISRLQLLALGWSRHEIDRRIASGRLHPLYRGVYAVGRPDVTREGWWMAAVLASGDGAALSHFSGAALWKIASEQTRTIHVSIPLSARRSQRGMKHHPRLLLPHETTTTPPELRADLDRMPKRPGRRALRETLDLRTFRFTRSQLERAFIPIALRAGLPRPQTCVVVNGWEVDFYWPDLDLVVEADSLTYHRTPQQQARDRLRDQAHVRAETERLRFTHSQIKYDPDYVCELLATVAARLRREQVRREAQELRHG